MLWRTRRFLVPSDLTVAQFVYVIRKRVSLKPSEAIWVFVEREVRGKRKLTLPPTSALLGQLYDDAKDDDGFLYLAVG